MPYKDREKRIMKDRKYRERNLLTVQAKDRARDERRREATRYALWRPAMRHTGAADPESLRPQDPTPGLGGLTWALANHRLRFAS